MHHARGIAKRVSLAVFIFLRAKSLTSLSWCDVTQLIHCLYFNFTCHYFSWVLKIFLSLLSCWRSSQAPFIHLSWDFFNFTLFHSHPFLIIIVMIPNCLIYNCCEVNKSLRSFLESLLPDPFYRQPFTLQPVSSTSQKLNKCSNSLTNWMVNKLPEKVVMGTAEFLVLRRVALRSFAPFFH